MIEYQFKSFFLDKVMGSLFKKATIKMLDALSKELEVYIIEFNLLKVSLIENIDALNLILNLLPS